ncbi:MAG: helix-turn-helix domain-containing protein [Bacillota bacterium]|nr:helix-turn-helix domain-containing protein [Bacillota bacterium]
MKNKDADQIEAVRKVQKYIESHLNSRITLMDLSRVSGYSQWHIERLFKELTGKTPFEYIRAMRLTKAAFSLRDDLESKKILDVALDYVFDSHEGFTRAFSKQFGIAPKAYQKRPEPIPLFLPYPVISIHLDSEKRSVTNMSEEKKVRTVFVQVIERPERKAIIKRGIKATHYFEYCEEAGCDVWGMLVSVKEALFEPAGFWLPDSWIKPGTSQYVQGVEVPLDYNGTIPEGFELISMPQGKMMIFQGEPYEDENFGEAIDEIWEIIKNYNPSLYGFEWADDENPRFQLEPQGYRGYIEGRPVKEVTSR